MNRKPTTKYDLEDRLIEFAVRIIDTAEALPKTVASKKLSGQIVRSGTSPALNYAEAQFAESKADFVHKMKICKYKRHRIKHFGVFKLSGQRLLRILRFLCCIRVTSLLNNSCCSGRIPVKKGSCLLIRVWHIW